MPDSWNFREIGSPTLDSLDAYYTLLRPNAIKIGRSSQTYNCHGYAWYMNEGHNNTPVWIGILNTQAQYIFWNGGSYNQVDPSVATIISYTENDNHSATKVDASGYYISKWGNGPLMRHLPYDCSWCGGIVGYYARAYIALQDMRQNISGEKGLSKDT